MDLVQPIKNNKMKTLLTKSNWKFIIDILLEKQYTFNNNLISVVDFYKDVEHIFSCDSDGLTMFFIETNEQNKTFTYHTRFINNVNERVFVEKLLNEY